MFTKKKELKSAVLTALLAGGISSPNKGTFNSGKINNNKKINIPKKKAISLLLKFIENDILSL
jgi:hypothetical protein